MQHSCLYSGHIRHRRFVPVENAFRYSICLLYLDLDELPHVFDGHRLWSYERNNLACWKRRHYIGPRNLPIREAVAYRVKDALGIDIKGPVRMLAHLQYAGYCYNPAAFYYCYNEDGTRVETIIVEITNTPWGERHAYVLGENLNEAAGPRKRYRFSKDFHVSPFMPMDIQYDWRFTEPGDRLTIHMINRRQAAKVFDATLALERRPLTAGNLNRVLLTHPLMTFKVVAMIHWQALRLWRKRCPFYEHPARRQADRKDPYASTDTTP